jgi:exopolysaccharide biosynthesis polyprenyl glycosylphosphotransferase
MVVGPVEVAHRRGRGRARQRTRWAGACLAVDVTVLALALPLVTLAEESRRPPGQAAWLVGFPIVVLGTLALRGLYRMRLQLDLAEDASRVAGATAVAVMIMASTDHVALAHSRSVSELLVLWATVTAALVAGRGFLVHSEKSARRRGDAGRRTLIVGAGSVGAVVAKRLMDHPDFGLRPVAFLDASPLVRTVDALGVPVVGASSDVGEVVRDYEIEHVVVSFCAEPHQALLDVVGQCEERGIPVSIVPRLFEKVTRRIVVNHLGGLPLLTVNASDPRGRQVGVKYALDRLFTCLILLLVLPLMAGAALATWVSVGRPILFRQLRVGRDGRVFAMLKFRSMRDPTGSVGAVELPPDTAPGGVEGDDRRTRVGSFLRKTSLDELPQVLNVLKGEMSLVGPRPERPNFVRLFDDSVYRYHDRLRVKSGITGWAQVNGLRGKTSIADRVEWDNYYIENWSHWFDVKIILQTFAAVFRGGQIE